MAYISEVKSRDDPTSASDYVEIVFAPGESADDFEIEIFRRNGNLLSTTDVESGTLVQTFPDGTTVYSLSVNIWEGGAASGPAAISLVSDITGVEQFVAVGTSTVTANGGSADGMVTDGVGNTVAGDSHYWLSDGTYDGSGTSTPGTICFAKGTFIETQKGPCLVEDLKIGDLIATRDDGYQRLRWIGRAQRSRLETAKHQNLRPVIVRKDAFGLGNPASDLVLSPQHRILSVGLTNCILFGEAETFIAAKHMINNTSIISAGACDVTYFHLMLEDHQVIQSNGTWTESFLPNDFALSTISKAARQEIESLFPNIQDRLSKGQYISARQILKKAEAKVLLM